MEGNDICTIYLVRHGESEDNVRNIVGRDASLSPKGRTQAAETAERLKGVRFDRVFSSDLARARQTAEIIAAERKLAIETRAILRERSYGPLDGKTADELRERMREARAVLDDISDRRRFSNTFPEGVENNDGIVARMMTFLREIGAAYPGETILVASHGGIMRAFLVHVGFGTWDTFKPLDIGNSAYVKVATDGIEFKVLETNGVKMPQA